MHKPFSPPGIHPPSSSYSHAVDVPAGTRLVFCSGQVGIRPDGTIPPDCAGQASVCFENIGAILAEAGMGLQDIVRVNAFVAGREHLQPFVEVRNAVLKEPFPASTLVIVSGFARPEFVVEIEVTAAAPA